MASSPASSGRLEPDALDEASELATKLPTVLTRPKRRLRPTSGPPGGTAGALSGSGLAAGPRFGHGQPAGRRRARAGALDDRPARPTRGGWVDSEGGGHLRPPLRERSETR